MELKVKDFMSSIDLGKAEVFLPLYESVVNSIISLDKVTRDEKRIEFAHEHEVRIVKMLDSQQARTNGPVLIYPLVQDFIEELTIDSRADVGLVSQLKDLMVAVGANPNIINQSNLYKFTPHRIMMQ